MNNTKLLVRRKYEIKQCTIQVPLAEDRPIALDPPYPVNMRIIDDKYKLQLLTITTFEISLKVY